jgi:predicted MFS family arabinose efflux permease
MAYLATTNTRIALDSRSSIWSIVFLSVLGPAMFILQPGYVQGLVQYAGFSEDQAGLVAAFEMFGIAATAVLINAFIDRFNWRTLTLVFILLSLLGNLLSIGQFDFETLRAIRFFTGVGSGGLISITFTMMGLTSRADRNMGLIVTMVLVWGALGLFAMPALFQRFGVNGFMWVLVTFSVMGLFVIRYLPCFYQTEQRVDARGAQISPALRYALLIGILLYNLAIGIVWVYLFLVGVQAGIAEQTVANVLTVSQVLGIGGALIAFFLEDRIGRLLPLQVSIVGAAVGIVLILGTPTLSRYALGVCLFNLLWNVTQPYIVAMCAAYDDQNHLVAKGVAMQMLGYAVGPMGAALLLSLSGYTGVNAIAIALFSASAVVLAVALLRIKQHTKATV